MSLTDVAVFTVCHKDLAVFTLNLTDMAVFTVSHTDLAVFTVSHRPGCVRCDSHRPGGIHCDSHRPSGVHCVVQGVVECCKMLRARMDPVRQAMGNPPWQQLVAMCYAKGIDLTAHYL